MGGWRVADILAQFNAYKSLVPVMGAIILDQEMEHCLLLRGVKNSASWGFPKGKVDQDEADIDCAVREEREETSLDISGMISEEKQEESKEVLLLPAQRSRVIEHKVALVAIAGLDGFSENGSDC